MSSHEAALEERKSKINYRCGQIAGKRTIFRRKTNIYKELKSLTSDIVF